MTLRRYSEDGPLTTPSPDVWLLRRVLAGWSAPAVVAATGGEISERTVYRWRRELLRLEDVVIAGHSATFAIRRKKHPIRVSPWTPAKDPS